MDFKNVYEDSERAEAYAKLEFPGTYYLAFRYLPKIFKEHVSGNKALDFGCGTGRSTIFLKKLGFAVVGVDISRDMMKKARELDPNGDYRLVDEGDLSDFPDCAFDLVLSAFTFDNIPTREKKVRIFRELKRVLKADGCIVNLVSSPEIYTHEWASFTTKDFPENLYAQSGDKVKIVMTDVPDRRPVEDIIWTAEDYVDVYRLAGLKMLKKYQPLADGNEPYSWVSETSIAPWTIYALK